MSTCDVTWLADVTVRARRKAAQHIFTTLTHLSCENFLKSQMIPVHASFICFTHAHAPSVRSLNGSTPTQWSLPLTLYHQSKVEVIWDKIRGQNIVALMCFTLQLLGFAELLVLDSLFATFHHSSISRKKSDPVCKNLAEKTKTSDVLLAFHCRLNCQFITICDSGFHGDTDQCKSDVWRHQTGTDEEAVVAQLMREERNWGTLQKSNLSHMLQTFAEILVTLVKKQT